MVGAADMQHCDCTKSIYYNSGQVTVHKGVGKASRARLHGVPSDRTHSTLCFSQNHSYFTIEWLNSTPTISTSASSACHGCLHQLGYQGLTMTVSRCMLGCLGGTIFPGPCSHLWHQPARQPYPQQHAPVSRLQVKRHTMLLTLGAALQAEHL